MATGKLIGPSSIIDYLGASPDKAWWDKWTADATGKVSQIRVHGHASGYVKVALYADNSGSPGTCLAAQDISTAISAGWNTVTLSSQADVAQGTVYWIAIANGDASPSYTYPVEGATCKYKSITYSSWTWQDNPTGLSENNTWYINTQGYGVLVLSPSGISQAIGYGTPAVIIAGIVISPQGITVAVSCGMPSLTYPQTISPPGLAVTIGYGTPSIGEVGIISPQGIVQPVAIGTPTILKYVWHVILDGSYITESQETNRACVIGRDQYGNPVFGSAVDSTELGLVGERLDFQQELAIPTTAQAESMASAILSKMRLTGKKGVILIPPNCGQELWDVVQIWDGPGNQSAIKFRVVGIRFEYNPRRACYHHELLLGAP
jgi:hypothetical protein